MDVSLLAISTAVPSFTLQQELIADKMRRLLSLDEEKGNQLKKVYQNSAIHTRYSVISDFIKEKEDWHFWGTDFPSTIPGITKRNEVYKVEAPKLAHEAASKAMQEWGGNPADISHVISVSCTGMIAPGIEFDLMQLLNLKPCTQRLGINFMGCFGAFKGLAVAHALAKEDPKHRILVVCTELCTLHFQANQTPDNLLANSLFSDGAAAVIVGGEPRSNETSLWTILKKASLGLDQTREKMKWEASDHGFVMKLSHTVPVLLGRHIESFVRSLADGNFTDCEWAIHPGGKSIIQAIEKALQLENGATHASWEVLANYGNMSSATFLFVLKSLLKAKGDKKRTIGIGFGPGLSMEGILLGKANGS